MTVVHLSHGSCSIWILRDEGYLLVSCAGGACATCHIPVEYGDVENNLSVVRIAVEGLTGGHSGVEIIKQRANADKQLAGTSI